VIIDGLRIYSIVLGVRADKLHQHALESISDMRDEPILVSGNVEDDAIIGDKVHCVPEVRLYVGGPIPARLPDIGKPCFERSARLRLTMPEGPQCGLRDDIHFINLGRSRLGSKSSRRSKLVRSAAESDEPQGTRTAAP
jgi:hypothetical protein